MADIPRDLTKYAAAGSDIVGLAARVVEFVRSLSDSAARARRLRRRAARVLRRAYLAEAAGRAARGKHLRSLAAALWQEAAALDAAPQSR